MSISSPRAPRRALAAAHKVSKPFGAIHRWMFRQEQRLLGRFNVWFTSQGGVWQTFLGVMAVVILEVIDRSLDPHAFVLMAVLTVYSGITQPMLAYANNLEAAKLQARIDQLELLLVQVLDERKEANR